MTFLYLCSLHNNINLHCNPLFFIFGMIVHCCASLCVISKVNARCGSAQRRIFLLTRSLINKKMYVAPLTLDQVWVGLWRSLFSVPQNSNGPALNTPLFLDQHAHGRTNGHRCICYLKNCTGCMIGLMECNVDRLVIFISNYMSITKTH